MNYPTLEDAIGKTPLVRLQRIGAKENAERCNVILGKLEGNNPAGSVKDRPAMAMIKRAEERGDIQPGDTLIEATSGNTGIALAMAAAIKGYRMILIMPEDLSIERVQTMKAYGADLILLAENFRDYGPAAALPQAQLRRTTERLLAEDWPETGSRRQMNENTELGAMMERVREEIRALKPIDDGQRWLQNQMLEVSTSLLRQRWLLVEQDEPSVRLVMVAVLVAWITLIFVSFGLNAPRNPVVVGSLLICALAIGASVFLILQLDRPFDGVMRVSSRPLVNALAHMPR